ncbi:MAG: ParB/RepB/Spo0J family partition protein [Cyanobacteriota bacterium]|nr:ParB/RepB/Spo0J family partition protein [Cyanobacteriota bacterium]
MAIAEIVTSQYQPRRYFDPQKQNQLEASIREHGILEPLIVRPVLGKFELIAGERRLRAAIAIGLTTVPVVIRELDDGQAMTFALVENLVREDLNPVEETEGIIALLAIELNTTPEEIPSTLYRIRNRESSDSVSHNVVTKIESIFNALGMTWKSFLTHRLPILKLPQDILDVLRLGQIEYTKAKAIAKLKDETVRQQLLTEAVENNMTLTQIKERIKELHSVPQQPDTPQRQIQGLTKRITKSKLWEKSPKKWKRVQTLLQKMEAILEEE